MNTFIWCLRRELWEHWALLLGLPVVLAAVVTIQITVDFYFQFSNTIVLLVAAPAETRAAFTLSLITTKFAALVFMQLALGLSILFYGSSTLYDDRRDGSNFFWKSLPLSDAKMVGAKATIVLVIAPLITIVSSLIVIAVSLLVVAEIAAFSGLNAFGALFASATLYSLIAKTIALWPIFVLTTLPALGWMLAISALVKKRPLIWIVGLPIIIALPISFLKSIMERGGSVAWVVEDVATRLLMGVSPGSWVLLRPSLSADTSSATKNVPGAAQYILQGWQIPTFTDYWIAAAIGLALIFLAVRIRRWRVDA
jgi:ABC-2 type transport system permease protein